MVGLVLAGGLVGKHSSTIDSFGVIFRLGIPLRLPIVAEVREFGLSYLGVEESGGGSGSGSGRA
jgi:hypothetical protein